MYDELVKRLRERCVFLFPHHGESRSYDADLMHEAADAIEELRQQVEHSVPVPPHGRLIDADALMDSDGDLWDGMWGWSGVQIANAPTIIPSEEGET